MKKEVSIKDDAIKPTTEGASASSSSSSKDTPKVKLPSKEVTKALSGGLGDAIIDIKVSKTEQQEADLSRNGYVQLLQDQHLRSVQKQQQQQQNSTFGKKCSLWIWKRNQGTCSGRLKPIIDIQLHKSNTSSDFVISGYLCDPTPIFGQWLWVRRAVNEDEEKYAIIDLDITTGKMKNQSDPIWKSPDVGWIRVDGNFTKHFFYGIDTILWIKPAQARTVESYMSSPTSHAVALSDEVRQAKLLSACRQALRHYVAVLHVKRLANLVMENMGGSSSAGGANQSMIRGERMMDYTVLFHQHVGKSKDMNSTKFRSLLYEVGLSLESKDVQLSFNLFDFKQNGFIIIEEFVDILSLTDYELDLAIEKIRLSLLRGCSSPSDLSVSQSLTRGSMLKSVSALVKPNSGVLGSGLGGDSKTSVGKNLIKENYILKEIFDTVNTKNDGIFSIDEIMDLASKVEVFLTEQEARKILMLLDVNHDNRVEEADFISFMRQDTSALISKAFRVREAAVTLRRWLVRGSMDKAGANNTVASTSQWKSFTKQYVKLTGRNFPGFLDSQLMVITMNNLSVRLSFLEARELTLLIAPEKNGRIHQTDIHAFMTRDLRSYGELMALMERDILKDLIDVARVHYNYIKINAKEDTELADAYKKKCLEIKTDIEKVYDSVEGGDDRNGSVRSPSGPGQSSSSSSEDVVRFGSKRISLEVVSIIQLKDGIENYVKKKGKSTLSEAQFPNLEELAALTVLVHADVAEGDIYGLRLMDFIEGICKYSIVTSEETKIRSGERFSIEQVSAELQRQLVIEAKNYSKDKNKPDYKTVFDFFDVNKNGYITVDEFKSVLIRLQLTSRLPDSLVPELIKLISKGKKEIKLEDLVAFAEKGSKKETPEEVDDKDDKEDEDDIEDMTSNVPPAVITQNKDCDWLLWFLYRQSLKVDPIDPESIITELEIRCNETELTQVDPAISVKELWNHLFELNLQGNMTQPQFLKGVQLVCRDSSGRDDDRVDYNALAKYVVRMGRAYNAAVQKRTKEDEGKFGPLLLEIKKFFKDIAEEKVDGKEPKPGTTRFEKLFHRLDSDKDGMLTVKEFKICLKRLQFKSVKSWTLRLIRRLFDECDNNKDGLLAIQEFSNYIQEKDDNVEKSKEKVSTDSTKTLATINSTKIGLNNLSDDEEDDVFRKNSRLTDNQLICKVNDLLMDVVPIDPNRPDRHGEVVRNSVRRFFHRADPERRGVVSEERFRAFLRRSGLQDVLTATELRRLTDKFKKRGVGAVGTGNGSGIQNDVLIDYELLCQQLHFTAETIPKSKAEVIFTRLQEAASISVNAGRPFLSLCSLVDLKLTGRITKDELLHITKMLNCPLKREEVDAMMELFPNHALGKDNTIDYHVIHNLLESYTPRYSKVKDIDPYFSSTFGKQSGTSSSSSSSFDSKVDGRGQRVNPLDISTPHGFKISAPASQQSSSSSSGKDGSGDYDPRYAAIAAAVGHDSKSNSDSSTLQIILKNVKEGIEQKSRNWGSPYSIRKQFQAFDSSGSLIVSLKIFQGVVGELSVNLSPADLKTISTLFGVSDDNKINYDLFCSVLEGKASSSSSSSSSSNKDSSKDGSKESAKDNGGKDKNKDKDVGDNKLSGSSKERMNGPRTYLNSRVLQRYSELVSEGNHPRDIFIAQDLDRSGMVNIHQFSATISKLRLLYTDHQISKAAVDFSYISNRSMIMYEDFLDTIEDALANEGSSRVGLSINTSNSNNNNNNNTLKLGYVDGSGYDGLRMSHNTIENWDDVDSFNANERFRRSGGRQWEPVIELEEGSDSMYYGNNNNYQGNNNNNSNNYRNSLSPPKPAGRSSLDFASSRYSNAGGMPFSPLNSYQRTLPVPHASPSKVGSKLWGSQTPLSKKGKIENRNPEKWCCAVCLYVENPKDAPACLVCDAPNYTTKKEYQVKEQCRNCTFLNGQYADECEMCGEQLSSSVAAASLKSQVKIMK